MIFGCCNIWDHVWCYPIQIPLSIFKMTLRCIQMLHRFVNLVQLVIHYFDKMVQYLGAVLCHFKNIPKPFPRRWHLFSSGNLCTCHLIFINLNLGWKIIFKLLGWFHSNRLCKGKYKLQKFSKFDNFRLFCLWRHLCEISN